MDSLQQDNLSQQDKCWPGCPRKFWWVRQLERSSADHTARGSGTRNHRRRPATSTFKHARHHDTNKKAEARLPRLWPETRGRKLLAPVGRKLRGQDLNLRPRGYEPRELPGCSTPRYERVRPRGQAAAFDFSVALAAVEGSFAFCLPIGCLPPHFFEMRNRLHVPARVPTTVPIGAPVPPAGSRFACRL